MFKKIIVFISLALICSCLKPTPKLPINSATFLINYKKEYTEIKEPTPLNVDIINGLRSLELNTYRDSLDLEGWNAENFSPKISFFRKAVKLNFNEDSFPSEIELTFFNSKLISIETIFDDLPHYQKKQSFGKERASREIFEPALLDTYYNVFGKNSWVSEKNKNLFPEDFDLYAAAVAIKKGEPYIKKNQNPFKEPVLFQGVQVPNNIISQKYDNEKRMTINGNKNKMIIDLLNEFEIDEPEGKLFPSYLLQNISLSIVILDKQEYLKYEAEKRIIEESREDMNLKLQEIDAGKRQEIKASNSAMEL